MGAPCSYARTPSQTIAPGLGGGPAEAQWRTGKVNTRQQRPRWHTVMQPVPSQSCARGPLRRTLERAQMPSSWPCRPSLDSSLDGGLVQMEQETTRVSPAELRMRWRTFADKKAAQADRQLRVDRLAKNHQFECGEVVCIWREPGKRNSTKTTKISRGGFVCPAVVLSHLRDS